MRWQHAEWLAQQKQDQAAITAEAERLDNTRQLIEEDRELVLSTKEYPEDYNRMVLGFAKRVPAYNARLDKLNALRDAYRARWSGPSQVTR